MRFFFYTVYLLFFSLTTNAQSSSEKTILNLSQKKFQWMVEKQYDSLDRVLDDRLYFVHSNGWAETKKEFFADTQSGKLIYTNISVTEAFVRLYGTSAVIIGRGNFSVRLDGKDMEFDLKYTEVYVYQNNRWQLVSRHANRMQ